MSYLENKSLMHPSGGFGSKSSRFDQNFDYQMVFNRSPGPGSYQLRKEKNSSKMIET